MASGRCGCRNCECIPAAPGETLGQILVWDGTAWVPNTAPSEVGQILVWDGTTWVPGTSRPWTANYGALSLNNLLAGELWGFQSEAAVLADGSGIGSHPFPGAGGVLSYITVRYRAGAPAQANTWTAFVNGVATALTVSLAAGEVEGETIANVALPPLAAAYQVKIRFTQAAATTGSTRPTVTVGGTVVAT